MYHGAADGFMFNHFVSSISILGWFGLKLLVELQTELQTEFLIELFMIVIF